jgi:hypothetical protein
MAIVWLTSQTTFTAGATTRSRWVMVSEDDWLSDLARPITIGQLAVPLIRLLLAS